METNGRRVLVVGYEHAELLDLASVVSTLQIANWLAERVIYRPELATLAGVPCRTASGLVLQADAALERTVGPLDTLVVSGGIGYLAAMDDRSLVAHVRRLARESRRVASVCTGSGVLAAAGLLDGHRAATHWDHCAYLAARFPTVHFDPAPIYITDGDVWTSAGVTAALDLTLSFVATDAGPKLAREVARQLVVYMQRPGDQAQMSMFTSAPVPGSQIVRDAIDHIDGHLADNLSTTALAGALRVSERHLCRLFSREAGVSPARFVRGRRTAAAAGMLSATDLTLEVIATRCGFGTVESLRQAFQRVYGVAPSRYRATHQRGLGVNLWSRPMVVTADR